jgi:hypothetical protein
MSQEQSNQASEIKPQQPPRLQALTASELLLLKHQQLPQEEKLWYENFHQQLEQRRMRPRVDEDEDAPDLYLVNVFYKSYLYKNGNHVGVFKVCKQAKTSAPYWIGLSDPPVFYMFDEITVEEFQKYIPVETTESRWERFKAEYNQHFLRNPPKHFSFQCVFRTLFEKGYITEVWNDQEVLDKSVEAAARKHLRETPEFEETKKLKIFGDDELFQHYSSSVAQAILKVHAVQHVMGAWVLTEAFWKLVKTMESSK